MGRHAIRDPDETQVFTAITEPVIVDPVVDSFPVELRADPALYDDGHQLVIEVAEPVVMPDGPALLVVAHPAAPADDVMARARLRQAADELRKAGEIPVVRGQPVSVPIPVVLVDEPILPTQVAHPMRAAARTSVQTGLAALIGFAGLWPALSPVFDDFFLTSGLPTPAYFGIILVGVSVVAGAISRLMAVPEVNDLLEKIKLGAAPAAAAPEPLELAEEVPAHG